MHRIRMGIIDLYIRNLERNAHVHVNAIVFGSFESIEIWNVPGSFTHKNVRLCVCVCVVARERYEKLFGMCFAYFYFYQIEICFWSQDKCHVLNNGPFVCGAQITSRSINCVVQVHINDFCVGNSPAQHEIWIWKKVIWMESRVGRNYVNANGSFVNSGNRR